MRTNTNKNSLVKATTFFESSLDGIYVVGSIFFLIGIFTGLSILTGGLVTLLLSAVALVLLPLTIILSIAVKFSNFYKKENKVEELELECNAQELQLLENYKKLDANSQKTFSESNESLQILQPNPNEPEKLAVKLLQKPAPVLSAWQRFNNFWGHARAGLSALKNPFTITRVLGTAALLALSFTAGSVLAAATPIILGLGLITCVLYNRFHDVNQTDKITALEKEKLALTNAVAFTEGQLTVQSHQAEKNPQDVVDAVVSAEINKTPEPVETFQEAISPTPLGKPTAVTLRNSSRVKTAHFQPTYEVRPTACATEVLNNSATSSWIPADMPALGMAY